MSGVLSMPVDVTELLDYDVLRAQLVNCLNLAAFNFGHEVSGAPAFLNYIQIEDSSAAFLLLSESEPRKFFFRVARPDGSSVFLTRLSDDNSDLELEEADLRFIECIRKSLALTIVPAFNFMVKPPVTPTHAPVPSLQ